MDHYATRYPTNAEDIADFLVRAIGTVHSFINVSLRVVPETL